MPMRQEDLETFVAVAESGTIAAAAEHLFITQSTASERIRSLEADIGHKLVERRRGVRKVALTPAGERLVPIASAILSLYDEAARVDMRPRRQRLIVAAADSLNGHLLIPFYRAFIADHPDILLELRTSMSPVINREVEERVPTSASPSRWSATPTSRRASCSGTGGSSSATATARSPAAGGPPTSPGSTRSTPITPPTTRPGTAITSPASRTPRSPSAPHRSWAPSWTRPRAGA